ncbi:MAG: GTP-dependent dephospho-CoA kinase family protein [Sulfolobales archaeon]
MPEVLRDSLARGFLGVKICGSEETVTNNLLNLLKDCSEAVVIGDFACLKLLESGYVPRVCVIDGVTRRTQAQSIAPKYFSKVIRGSNPRSHVCQGAVEKILEAMREAKQKESTLILIDGEEDLLALPAIAEAPLGWCVIYGLPECGVELVVVDQDTAKSAKKILDLFEEVELQL